MSNFTLDDVRTLMRTSMGVDETVDLDGDISDTEFDELGYDSLAVLAMAGHLQRVHHVAVPDDAVLEIKTPRALVEFVNAHFAEAGV